VTEKTAFDPAMTFLLCGCVVMAGAAALKLMLGRKAETNSASDVAKARRFRITLFTGLASKTGAAGWDHKGMLAVQLCSKVFGNEQRK